MVFKPKNLHLEVEPLEAHSIIASKDVAYEEKGIVVSIAEGVTVAAVDQIVYFDSWMASKFSDSQGHIRWLIPQEAVRAVEYE